MLSVAVEGMNGVFSRQCIGTFLSPGTCWVTGRRVPHGEGSVGSGQMTDVGSICPQSPGLLLRAFLRFEILSPTSWFMSHFLRWLENVPVTLTKIFTGKALTSLTPSRQFGRRCPHREAGASRPEWGSSGRASPRREES